jgi:hypothetical protein
MHIRIVMVRVPSVNAPGQALTSGARRYFGRSCGSPQRAQSLP